MSWGPNFYRTLCPDDAKISGHQTCRKQNPWWWTKHEKLKFTSLIISPGSAAIDWSLIMKLFSVQPKLCVPDVRMHLSTCSVLHWSEHKCDQKIIAGLSMWPWHHKNNGTWDHQNCILVRPRSWWGLEQFHFLDCNRSMAGDHGDVYHCVSAKNPEFSQVLGVD